jgi:hypothetical protein
MIMKPPFDMAPLIRMPIAENDWIVHALLRDWAIKRWRMLVQKTSIF